MCSTALNNDEIKVGTNLYCIDFPFKETWFVKRAKYWLTDLDFEVRACQTHCDPSAHVLVDWRSVKNFAALSRDLPILKVGIEAINWSSYFSHRLLGGPMPSVLAYYSILVLRPQGTQRHLTRDVAPTEFAICKVMRFLLAVKEGILSTHRHRTDLQLGHPIIGPVSHGVQEVLDQLCFLEIMQAYEFDVVAALMD